MNGDKIPYAKGILNLLADLPAPPDSLVAIEFEFWCNRFSLRVQVPSQETEGFVIDKKYFDMSETGISALETFLLERFADYCPVCGDARNQNLECFRCQTERGNYLYELTRTI